MKDANKLLLGRTSSISHEILGFDSEGRPVDYTKCKTAEEICDNSSKVITFIDLGGHQKYLKTTIYGLTGYSPHYAMLVVSCFSQWSHTKGQIQLQKISIDSYSKRQPQA